MTFSEFSAKIVEASEVWKALARLPEGQGRSELAPELLVVVLVLVLVLGLVRVRAVEKVGEGCLGLVVRVVLVELTPGDPGIPGRAPGNPGRQWIAVISSKNEYNVAKCSKQVVKRSRHILNSSKTSDFLGVLCQDCGGV